MGRSCRILVLAATASMLAGVACAQDSPSLGDVARQQRLQKGSTAGKDAHTPRVITNEEIPEQSTPETAVEVSHGEPGSLPESANGMKQSSEHWKSQIQAEKNQISSLQKQIDQMNQSIHFASHVCTGPRCVEWNERQREKQEHVERMQEQLTGEKKRLEEMQELARKQGYGNSVYDP